MVGAPPRYLLWVSGAVVVVGTAMVVIGAYRTGISWDEPYHVARLRNYFEHGWYAVDWSVADGGATDGESNTLVYGPVTMLLLHGFTVLLGESGWYSVATTPEAYAARHLGVALIALVGTAAAAATTRILLGSWRWALVTAAVLLALPMWAGHAMMNVKDVPVATGYSLTTLALVAMVRPEHGRRWGRIALLVAGVVLMAGTRPGMVPAIGCGAALLVGGRLLVRGRDATHPAPRPAVVELVTGLALAAAVLVVVYPGVFAHPLRLLGSAERSSAFRDTEVSRLYVPFHLLAQFPLLLQAAFVVGLVSMVRFALRRWRTEPGQTLRLALVSAQLAAFPVAAVVTGAELYNGLRQLLFLTPAWAVVTTLGLAHALGWTHARDWRPRLVKTAAVTALVAPVLTQATLFPYQYTYWNPAMAATGVHVSTDYWRTSATEMLPRIPVNGAVVCSPTRYSAAGDRAGTPEVEGIDRTELIAGRFSVDSSVDCRTDPLGPLATPWADAGRPVDHTLPHDEYYAVIDRDHPLPRNCAELASVDRRPYGRAVTMTYLARCRLDAPLLDRPVTFERDDSGAMSPQLWAFAAEGWVQRGSARGIEATDTTAALTFAVPPGCETCALRVDGEVPADLVVSVGGTRTRADVSAGSVVVPLPGTSDAWVGFTRTSGGPLGLRVDSLRMVLGTGTGAPR